MSGTDLFGCVGFDTVTVFVPNASAGLTRIICAGDSVQLTASLFNAQPGSGVSYSWSSSNPQPGITNPASAITFVKPATSGTYTYTVQITSSGCTFNSSVNVIVLPRPTINLGSDLMIAPGATISITPTITGVSSTTTYQWSFLSGQQHGSLSPLNSMNTQFTANTTSFSTVEIVLSAINPSGCTNTDTLMITIDPSLQGASLSGQLVYDNSTASPLANGKVFLQFPSGRIDSATVSGSGSFLFNGLQDSIYKLSGITYQVWGGVTVSDAAIINNNVTNPTLVGLRLKAADVTGDGFIFSNDAQQTAMRASELPIDSSFDNNGPGNWAYDTTTVNIAGSNVVHNPKSISYGDVDGSYSPVLRRSGTMILESIGELNLKPRETTAIPIRLSQNAEIGIAVVSLGFKFNSPIVSRIMVPERRKTGEYEPSTSPYEI
ncbi:MAG: PKD domain-containing protein, partial [Bacteroidota bacterium]